MKALSGVKACWALSALQKVVDQFVLHYDACGLSQLCFQALHSRGLSVHFLLDIDGTVYQTLDLQERALHATIANDRSIGIEIANIGAYPAEAAEPLDAWYARESGGRVALTVPARLMGLRVLTPDFRGRPAQPKPVTGSVQGQTLTQFDFTPEQYAALVKLTAALSRVFPQIRPRYPHAFLSRNVISHTLSKGRLLRYHGVLGHFHVQDNKVDPGPAFDWPEFMAAVRAELRGAAPKLESSFKTP
jgi:N-acetyl-anhydromuramyl-L-alanine amidase AmpD